MNSFRILDCTLRDGGYINDWNFGHRKIKSILHGLTQANIDIIECGFLEDTTYNNDCSFFSSVDQIEALLPKDKGNTQYVAMTRFGYLDLSTLKPYDGKSIDGIRVTFHENEVQEAIAYCRQIKELGYKVYVQPVGTTSYSDKYLLELVELVNELEPYAFYIVDTLGLMRQNDVLRMFYLVDNNLREDIIIGFHSHNNLQLSFSNTIALADVHTKRSIIADSSVYGMGRGAGNLNTELITQHFNMIKGSDYKTDYLLEIIDETISPLLDQYSWGYSVPYYLAAINNCHPNYATYLINRKTLPVKSISMILSSIAEDQRELYSKEYISELYMNYQEHFIDDSAALKQLGKLFEDQPILVVAPGPSIKQEQEKINAYIEEKQPIVISINFDGNGINPSLYFFSNKKRFQAFSNNNVNPQSAKVVVTSNINDAEAAYQYKVNYSDYLNTQPLVNDNATLMLLSLLIKLGVKHVAIAGFDGFQSNDSKNYFLGDLETSLDSETFTLMNEQIADVVEEYRGKIDLMFLTDSLYNK